MRKVVYSMQVSLDGYIAGPGGAIDWSVPDEELHRFHNEHARGTGAQVYGRRMYETMRFWETAGDDPSAPEPILDFARIWKATPKLVCSRTLEAVGPDYELVNGDLGETLEALKAQDGGDIAVSGADLAASAIERGLIDEYRQFVYPIVLGGGTPFFPPLDARIPLRLAESRTFGTGVVYLRYERQ
jgi:dihydrofolate reductase